MKTQEGRHQVAGDRRARTSARTGEVTRVLPERDQVIVDGVNVAKRHQQATQATMQGGIIDKDMPIHVSNVAIVCTSCGTHRASATASTATPRSACAASAGRTCDRGDDDQLPRLKTRYHDRAARRAPGASSGSAT